MLSRKLFKPIMYLSLHLLMCSVSLVEMYNLDKLYAKIMVISFQIFSAFNNLFIYMQVMLSIVIKNLLKLTIKKVIRLIWRLFD